MPHQFASINCKECGTYYCPVCEELCPNCGKDGIRDDNHRKQIEEWRKIDKERKKKFEERSVDRSG